MKELLGFLSNSLSENEKVFTESTAIILEQYAYITDQTANEQLLKELLLKYAATEQKLIELNKQKNRFLGMAAHDLRNPLVSIRGFSEMLLEDGLDDETRREFLTLINSTSEEMLSMLNDLLDISHIESGRFFMDMKKGSIRELVLKRVHLMEPAAHKKGMRITTALSEVPVFQFDPAKIGQVVDNFISNAVKYSPYDTEIKVTLENNNGFIKLSVTDQGPGISLDERHKLFGEFSKLNVQATGGEKSSGLGLAIAKKIIESHKGSVGVDSEPGVGSTFFFSIPLTKGATNGD